jgi:hypothetical protein
MATPVDAVLNLPTSAFAWRRSEERMLVHTYDMHLRNEYDDVFTERSYSEHHLLAVR